MQSHGHSLRQRLVGYYTPSMVASKNRCFTTVLLAFSAYFVSGDGYSIPDLHDTQSHRVVSV